MSVPQDGLQFKFSPQSGQVVGVQLFGEELLDQATPCQSELWVNGQPLALRPHRDPNDPTRELSHLKGERFVDHFSGWSLVLARRVGGRAKLKYPCVGIETLVRRELCDQTCPCPGPGGPVVEAPLHVDSFGLLNWNWRFWGDETRMIFPSTHSSGPADEFGHCGYEHDTPERCKTFLQNTWRRIYPGCMVIHGGLFYNARSEHWLAITCRRPGTGYILNIADAGRGVGYDFTLHAPFGLGETLRLPEIKLYYGRTRAEMMSWLGEYASFYYEEPPAWVHRTLFGQGLAWNNQPTWREQADHWEKELAAGTHNGIGYSLVTNRPIHSGTTPLGYEPDPNHGTRAEFKAMCHRLADLGVPVLVWMSHSGLAYRGGDEIDDDWFIRGIDDRVCASWGSVDFPELCHINPGHPGYLEYTRKWIRFYIRECRCKGIFLDCLSWAFPPDYRPRDFMRFPGDTNRMAIRFMDEVYACLKECDPEAILLGEGSSLDMPVNVFSIHTNTVRAPDGLGPRDFMLQLNQWSPKRFCVDQGPRFFPASGYCTAADGAEAEADNRYLCRLLREQGGSRTFTALPGDLSVCGDLLIVPAKPETRDLRLPAPWQNTRVLQNVVSGQTLAANAEGVFPGVARGLYRMQS